MYISEDAAGEPFQTGIQGREVFGRMRKKSNKQ
jgi:hypothetical protein